MRTKLTQRKYPVSMLFLSLCLYSAFSSVRAQTAAQGNRVRLDDLVAELIRSNPELQAARKGYEAALTRPSQEGALPDPRITAGWISSGFPYPGAGLGTEPTSNIGFQLSQEIPFPGKRAIKSGLAQKEVQSLAHQVRNRELNLIMELKSRFYELRLVYESIDLLRERQSILLQLAKAAEIRYATGQGAQQDVLRAGTELAILESRFVALEQKKITLGAQLEAMLNRPPDAEMGRPEAAGAMPGLEPFDSLLVRALQGSPVLGAQKSLIDSRQLNIQSAQKAYYPDFDVMSGYYNMGSMKPMWEFKVQVNIPLYFWKKQRSGLEEAGALLGEARHDYRAQEQAVGARLREFHAAAEAARKLADLYTRQIVPGSELTLESSLAGYAAGTVDFTSVLANFGMILDYQLNAREQQTEYLKALAGIEAILGDPIPLDGPANLRVAAEVRR
jgi:cobalt-zinc-cadmium efflux system outer membrane protein